MPTRYVVIMAGGSGTRFWPKSRTHLPKQFLPLGGDQPLLRETVDRVLGLVERERVLIVTGAAHADHARALLPDIPAENMLVEPEGRNTAPCILWACLEISRRDPDALMAVLPADHFIGDVAGFVRHLDAAFEAALPPASPADARIVLFGIVPTRPETGYGYIERGPRLGVTKGMEVDRVARFVEKPDRETALAYLRGGRHLWNSGMFVFRAALMLEELARWAPDLQVPPEVVEAPDTITSHYAKLPSISIDYAVMEKSERTAVLPASFAWSDVGSWDAAMEIAVADANENVAAGDALIVGSRRAFVDARGGRFVAVVGVEDVIVVDTEDALLVIRRGESQAVKQVVEALKSRARKELL